MSTRRWLKGAVAAPLVGLRPRSLARLATAGLAPHRRVNARVFLYDLTELNAWIDSRPGVRLEEVTRR